MFKRRNRREVPRVNTTSTADISFILLVFFLMITSMDVDKGLARQLPPLEDEERSEAVDMSRADVLSLRLTPSGGLLADDEPLDVGRLRSRVMAFVVKSANRGRQVITLDVDRSAPYSSYFNVQNEIAAAYNTLRDKYARRVYGRAYAQCDANQRETIRAHYPQRIVETSSDERKGGAE